MAPAAVAVVLLHCTCTTSIFLSALTSARNALLNVSRSAFLITQSGGSTRSSIAQPSAARPDISADARWWWKHTPYYRSYIENTRYARVHVSGNNLFMCLSVWPVGAQKKKKAMEARGYFLSDNTKQPPLSLSTLWGRYCRLLGKNPCSTYSTTTRLI